MQATDRQRLLSVPPHPVNDAGHLLASHACPAAASAEIVFDVHNRMAFCAFLDGSLVAWKVTPPDSDSATARLHDGESAAPAAAPDLHPAWQYSCPSPLFSTPLLVPGQPAVVVAAAADGTLTGLHAVSGALLWTRNLGAGIFTPLLLVQNTADGTHVLAGTEHGELHLMHAASGMHVNPPFKASSARVTALAQVYQGARRLLCVACADESLPGEGFLDAQNLTTGAVHRVRLPGQVFALAPAPGLRVLIGCRDNRVYALNLLDGGLEVHLARGVKS